MSYEKVSQAKKILIGTKQAVRALESGEVRELVVAADADPSLTARAVAIATERSVPVLHVDSMKKLGMACGIRVGTSTAAIIS